MKQLSSILALMLVSSCLLKAQEASYFRIVGPVATTITGFSNGGYISWTNVPTNTTFTVQIARSLAGVSNWVDYIQVPAINGETMLQIIDLHPPADMSLVPAGTFTMGDSVDSVANSLPLHTVYVSAFYMDQYGVTKALWDNVCNWATNHGYNFDNPGLGKAGSHPVYTVNWFDCVKWCNARSEMEGRIPAYYTDTGLTNLYQIGQTNPFVNWRAGYRLPTEAEWEKAARGGISGQRFPWGSTISWDQANYYAFPAAYVYDVNPTQGYNPAFTTGGKPYTSPVGYFSPNGYDLYDMEGNVYEWCWDWSGNYSNAAQIDPLGPANGPGRILRSSSWDSEADFSRTASRGYSLPGIPNNTVGFRSVLPK